MRPIPWILAAVALTALGILSTYEGQTTLTPPPGAPSLFGGRRVAVAVGTTSGDAALFEAAPTIPVPADITLAVSKHAQPLVPAPSLLLLVASGKTADAPLLLGPTLPLPVAGDASPASIGPAGEGDAPSPLASHSLAELPAALKTALGAAGGASTSLAIAFDRLAHFDDCIRPVLAACAEAGLYEVHLVVRPSADSDEFASILYRFPETEGAITPVLTPRATREGGILHVKAGARTFFAFENNTRQRASQLLEDIRKLHVAALDFNGENYTDSGLAWAIRMEDRAWFMGLVEAAGTLADAGIARFGLSHAHTDDGEGD